MLHFLEPPSTPPIPPHRHTQNDSEFGGRKETRMETTMVLGDSVGVAVGSEGGGLEGYSWGIGFKYWETARQERKSERGLGGDHVSGRRRGRKERARGALGDGAGLCCITPPPDLRIQVSLRHGRRPAHPKVRTGPSVSSL